MWLSHSYGIFQESGLQEEFCLLYSGTQRLTGRDVVEKFLAAGIWPLQAKWKLFKMEKRKVPSLVHEITFPVFGLKKPEGANDFLIITDVEKAASNLVGPYSKREKKSMLSVLERVTRINRPWEEMKVEYGPREVSPKPPQKRMRSAGNIGSEVTMASKKTSKKTTPKALTSS